MANTEMEPRGWLQRLGARIDALPEFWRPAAYGAGIVLMWMGMRGAIFVIPIAVVYVFITSQTPLADLGKGVTVVALAMLGGALSGLAYSAIGRRLLKFRPIGRYLAGTITLAPYMFVLIYIVDFTKGVGLLHRPTTEDLVIAALMAVFFGVVMGRSWFGDAKTGERHPS